MQKLRTFYFEKISFPPNSPFQNTDCKPESAVAPKSLEKYYLKFLRV